MDTSNASSASPIALLAVLKRKALEKRKGIRRDFNGLAGHACLSGISPFSNLEQVSIRIGEVDIFSAIG